MATYDPQKGHARPKPASDEPAPVDELLDVAADDGTAVVDPEPAPPTPAVVPDATPAPAQSGGATTSPGKKVGIGVALTAVVFALSWALRRKRRQA